jgi:hypothetical protein
VYAVSCTVSEMEEIKYMFIRTPSSYFKIGWLKGLVNYVVFLIIPTGYIHVEL